MVSILVRIDSINALSSGLVFTDMVLRRTSNHALVTILVHAALDVENLQ